MLSIMGPCTAAECKFDASTLKLATAGSVATFSFRFRRRNIIAPNSAKSSASPPATLPTITPVLLCALGSVKSDVVDVTDGIDEVVVDSSDRVELGEGLVTTEVMDTDTTDSLFVANGFVYAVICDDLSLLQVNHT